MTDRFHKKTQELLRDGRANGGIENIHLFDLIVASHDENVAVAKEFAEKVEARCDQMDAKFSALDCVKDPRHHLRRNYDEPDRRMWVMWNVLIGFVKAVALPVLVAVVVTLLLTGTL